MLIHLYKYQCCFCFTTTTTANTAAANTTSTNISANTSTATTATNDNTSANPTSSNASTNTPAKTTVNTAAATTANKRALELSYHLIAMSSAPGLVLDPLWIGAVDPHSIEGEGANINPVCGRDESREALKGGQDLDIGMIQWEILIAQEGWQSKNDIDSKALHAHSGEGHLTLQARLGHGPRPGRQLSDLFTGVCLIPDSSWVGSEGCKAD